MVMLISSLNRKLWRDLGAMRAQALAIAMVVAAGVALYVTYLANFESLQRAQADYYQRQRFGDVFATLKRAPLTLRDEIESIPDVTAAELRVVTEVVLDLPDVEQPAHARLVSIPADRRPLVNDLYLRRGRWIDAGRPDEVLISEGFVDAHGLEPGDVVVAIINGTRRALTIAGVAISPEYIYVIRPAELVPDDRRFGIFWMNAHALATALDMEGGFNDVTLRLAPGATTDEVIARLDRLFARYGGVGAVPRELQPSHWALQSELRQLESMGLVLPLIFLMVAAFVLNIALTRALALQRAQIAPSARMSAALSRAGFLKISALGVEEQRVNAIIEFDDPTAAARMLGDGFRVEARIAIWQADDVVMVPVGALFRRGGDWAVFVVRDGRALLRTVDLGERNNETAHVKDGVCDGERVIAHPPDTLEDGAPVRERM